MAYVGLEFDSGVLSELKSGGGSWIEIDLELNSVFIFLNDFHKDISSFELDVEYWLETQRE